MLKMLNYKYYSDIPGTCKRFWGFFRDLCWRTWFLVVHVIGARLCTLFSLLFLLLLYILLHFL